MFSGETLNLKQFDDAAFTNCKSCDQHFKCVHTYIQGIKNKGEEDG